MQKESAFVNRLGELSGLVPREPTFRGRETAIFHLVSRQRAEAESRDGFDAYKSGAYDAISWVPKANISFENRSP